jgi:hypothetical protein
LEWLVDEHGCDLISSSLGYDDWYEDSDFDGNTAMATIAADLAAARGALVVNAVGNEGCYGGNNLLSPADGDSVLAVGAVYFNGDVVSYSSCGPTFDGRIKPDAVAPGEGVRVARPGGMFGDGGGTSFATPLVTGVCALILQRKPHLTPYDLIELIRSTATHAHKPSNEYGWGLVQVAIAVGLRPPVIDPIDAQAVEEGGHLEFRVSVIDPDGDPVTLAAENLPRHSTFVDSGNGIGAFSLDPDYVQSGSDSVTIIASDGIFADTEQVAITIGDVDVGRVVGLFEAWPNPADSSVSVGIPAADWERSRLQVFTITGGRVYEATFSSDGVATWRGETASGGRAAAGIYLLRVQTPSREELIKVAWIPTK